MFVKLKDLEIRGNPNDDERVKNHACAAFASHFPFIMCYVFFSYITKAYLNFSGLQTVSKLQRFIWLGL